MRTSITLFAIAACSGLQAQTLVQITNVKIKDGDLAVLGSDARCALDKAGGDPVVLYEHDGLQIKTWYKASTLDVSASSAEKGAVNLVMHLQLFIAGQKQDERRAEKIIRPQQARTASYKERFVVKGNKGARTRTIEISFDAELL